MSFCLSILLALMTVFPHLPVLRADAAAGDTVILTTAHGDFGGSHKLYCIDKGGLAVWGIADDGDVYERHRPSEMNLPLSLREQEYVFWGILTLQASLGVREANDVLGRINANAKAQGKEPIGRLVTEEDLKALIYSSSVREKYPWLETAAAHTEEYLRMGGLLGGGGAQTASGKQIPSVLASSTSPSSAYAVGSPDFTIRFSEDGADADFIEKVPLLFSNDNGATYSAQPTDGWMYTKTRNSIIFSHPNPQPPKALIRFATEGTEYAASGGAYSSTKELFDACLQVWECVQCSGAHTGGTPPVSDVWVHQRMVWLEIKPVDTELYASLGGAAAAESGDGSITFRIFRHAEDFTSHYNVQLYKYDHETGKPLEGARFVLFERFDDKEEIDRERDGPVHIYEGGEPFAGGHTDHPAVWDGFRKAASVVTDENGHAARTVEHGYHYDKTFCDGHPAPVFTAVPEPEEDEETGDLLNGEAIEAARAKNRELADTWLSCADACRGQAKGNFEGVHFHWIMNEVNVGEIERTASSGGEEGQTPDGGITSGADGETAYEKSGCRADLLDTYAKFISMKYSYAFTEFQAREGYIRHDIHADDLPIEVITTDSSENGANAHFAGEYSKKEELESQMTSRVELSSHTLPTVQAAFEFVDEDADTDSEASPSEPSLSESFLSEEFLSGASLLKASPSEASASEAEFAWIRSALPFQNPKTGRAAAGEEGGTDLFTPAYEEALVSESVGAGAEKGPADRYSHCSGADGEGDAWRIYDHRTEGEFHINKKDLDLASGESEAYDAGGDTQGDAALEGAVYGLFAAEDLIHPDGKTGAVYRANQLVAIAATDKNGDASFLVNTEAPGHIYDYSLGDVVETEDGWVKKAPRNLYASEKTYDDYTGDEGVVRSYENLDDKNGNCWIGRPLLMGEYYVKELSRSEGYELSIGNRRDRLTNFGQDVKAQVPEPGSGYAGIRDPLAADEQTSESGDGAGPNELFFSSVSKDTENGTYDILLTGLPEGVSLFRKETGTKKTEVTVGTGTYEKVYLTNPDGSPQYITAEEEYQYPRYNPDGSLMTREIPVNETAEQIRQVHVRRLEETLIREALLRAEDSMTEEENMAILDREFSENDFSFVKGKTEAALRRNGKSTPRRRKPGGGFQYSGVEEGIFDRGVREGETDPDGLSGAAPGSPAACTVYGAPVQTVSVEKEKEDGTALTVCEVIVSLLSYYDSHPYYSYGGIEKIEDTGEQYLFTVYAGVSGNPKNFMVLGSDPEEDSIIYHAISCLPMSLSEPPRLVYVPYSNNPDYSPFGIYENYSQRVSASSVLANALLIPAADVDDDGKITVKKIRENVYYEPGEQIYDKNGDPVQAFEYREKEEIRSLDTEEVRWQPVKAVRGKDGAYVIRVDAVYTDSFGVVHTNSGKEQLLEWKAVLKEKEVILSKEDAAALSGGFAAGNPMDSASYYTHVRKASAKAYLDYENTGLTGDNTYLIPAKLVYPGQEKVYQDDGTRQNPGQVYERIIRQKIRIRKDIETGPDGDYAHNTNAETGHKDAFTSVPGSVSGTAASLPNFRFKIYLKSNLERLYRDGEGNVVWLDRDGKETDVRTLRDTYPAQDPYAEVPKLYTKVLHRSDSLTTGSVSNNVWDEAVSAGKSLYSAGSDGLIQDEQNPGYIRLLETVSEGTEDGSGGEKITECYNYEKFFDAIRTANHDKWDQGERDSTSFKPFSWIREALFGSEGGEKAYPTNRNNRPIRNKSRTSEEAAENRNASDMVRQFAVTWYLDEEVKKLTEKNDAGERQPEGGSEAYQEEIYDKALRKAIQKAENYLKPFFAYDLDTIYAVEWDSDPDGGVDRDASTLSADMYYETERADREGAENGYFYGVSKYLPYGVYVAVEEQPCSAKLGDFFNKHYKTDEPKEITVPSLYETGEPEAYEKEYHPFYSYESSASPEKLAKNYQIRMNEEWAASHTDDLRGYVIRAHNHDGDFEVYKYGLTAGKRMGDTEESGISYQGFTFTQESFDPYKDVYENENHASNYRSNQKVEKYYHYASLSEQVGRADDVKTITGALTGYDGRYFAALAPWTVREPKETGVYDAEAFSGYADGIYKNTFYTSKLRIEKLDSETGENILHDGALFALYSAKREDGSHTDGHAAYYEADTVITGSREFLEAMGAFRITPAARAALPWEIPYQGLYYGTVPAGTPVCEEKEQVVLTDAFGNKTGLFEAFSTERDGEMKDRGGHFITASQNVGYLKTPQPLGAGCYVLCEMKAPSGYVRSRPIAIEIYSDAISYYLDGEKDSRTAASVYEDMEEDTARVYVNNTPIRLEITKAKPDETEVYSEINGRLEGSLTELDRRYGLENLEVAYSDSDAYLGYGWKKGFLDSLKKKQEAGEPIEILYEDGVFTGRAVLRKALETADDANRYLPGAKMTLYDAIEVKPSGDQEDYQFLGLQIERDSNGNINRMYVQKGYAGNAVKFVRDKSDPAEADPEDYRHYTYEDQEDDRGEGVWICKTVERDDTDILYYDLGGLSVSEEIRGIVYGYDKNGSRIQAKNGKPIYALKNGTPMLEIISPDYGKLYYSRKDRVFSQVPEGTVMYHLDGSGNRDSRVNPYTGMAYVTEEASGKTLVWPVQISKDSCGNIISREKIKTSRLASFFADTEKEYTIGTYEGSTFRPSVNPILNAHGQPEYYQQSAEIYQKGNPIYDRDGDYVRYRCDDSLKAYNRNAWEINTSGELSDIGSDPEDARDDRPLFHRQGEGFLIENTWITGERTPNDPLKTEMTGGQADVLKRVPAGPYIMEELEPPQGYVKTMPSGVIVEDSGKVQTAKVIDWPIRAWFDKVDEPKDYEIPVLDREGLLREPEIRLEGKGGYSFESVKGTELALFKARRVSSDKLSSHPFGYYLEKAEDTPARWTVLDNENRPRSYTAKWTVGETPKYLESIPAGEYILEEIKTLPGYIPASRWVRIEETKELQYISLPNDHTKAEFLKYEQPEVPISADAKAVLSLYAAVTDEQGIVMKNGVPEYQKEKRIDTWTADDCREYTETADVSRYEKTEGFSAFIQRILLKEGQKKSGFIHDFEALYEEYGTSFEEISWKVEKRAVRLSEDPLIFVTEDGKRMIKENRESEFLFDEEIGTADRAGFLAQYQADPDVSEIRWLTERKASRISLDEAPEGESVRQLWKTDRGQQILIDISRGLTDEGVCGYIFDYKFHYKRLEAPGSPYAVSYDTPQGRHRIDYLACGKENTKTGGRCGYYVLVEEQTPVGYETAVPKAIVLEETEQIQLYGMENRKKDLEIIKTDEAGIPLAGAQFSLYKAGTDESLRKEPKYLADVWISGEDGTYTSRDQREGKIPDGFQEGGLRPHRIEALEDGIYYLVEERAPEGYCQIEPQKLRILNGCLEDGSVRLIVPNKRKKGIVEIWKADEENPKEKLSGAVFELQNLDTGELSYVVTGENGSGHSSEVVTGRIEKGIWKPYRFSVRELIPPAHYELKLARTIFTFSDDGKSEKLSYELEVTDEPTRITIAKTDFKTGQLVRGAILGVYETKETGGTYEAVGEPLETWCSDGNSYTLTGVLSAGGVYLLKELEAPEGYGAAKPVLFSVSDDGRSISGLSLDAGIVRFQSSPDFPGTAESLTVWGRRAVTTRRILRNPENGWKMELAFGEGVPADSPVLEEGRLYEETEETIYTDGTSRISSRRLFPMKLRGDGSYLPDWRMPQETILSIEEQDGSLLECWQVENHPVHGYQKTIYNPEYEDKQGIEAAGTNGKGGAAVLPGSVIRYEVVCKNTERETKDVTAFVRLDHQLEWMPANSSPEWRSSDAVMEQKSAGAAVKAFEDSIILAARILDLEPGGERRLVLTAAVKPEAEDAVRCTAKIGVSGKDSDTLEGSSTGNGYEAVNPIGGSGSLTLMNRVTGTAAETVSSPFSYRAEFFSSDGEPLKGLIPYSGSQNGVLRSGAILSLKPGEYITFSGFPWGTSYRIRETEETSQNAELEFDSVSRTGAEGMTGSRPASALFVYEKRDGSRRDKFRKGRQYSLLEQTLYSDGTRMQSARRAFGLDEEASPDWFDISDEQIELWIEKTDRKSKAAVTGAKLQLLSEAGALLEEWETEENPHLIQALLSQEERVVLHEAGAPPGYGMAEDITFTIPKEGGILQVEMADEPIRIKVDKLAAGENGAESVSLAGALLAICRPDGTIEEEWISDGSPHLVNALLLAGSEYLLVEMRPPQGYAKAPSISFTVPKEGGEVYLRLVNHPTRLTVRKLALESDGMTRIGPLAGAVIRIETEDGREIYRFTTDESGSRELKGILTAGETYCAVEETPPEGYEKAEPVWFTIDEGNEMLTILIYDVKKETPKPDREHPGKPDRPKKPEEPNLPLEGTITVHFDEIASGRGRIYLEAEKLTPLPETGEGMEADFAEAGEQEAGAAGHAIDCRENTGCLLLLIFLSAAGLTLMSVSVRIVYIKKREKRSSRRQSEK